MVVYLVHHQAIIVSMFPHHNDSEAYVWWWAQVIIIYARTHHTLVQWPIIWIITPYFPQLSPALMNHTNLNTFCAFYYIKALKHLEFQKQFDLVDFERSSITTIFLLKRHTFHFTVNILLILLSFAHICGKSK